MNIHVAGNSSRIAIYCLAAFFCVRLSYGEGSRTQEVRVMKAVFSGNAAEVPADSVIQTGFRLQLVCVVVPDDPRETKGKGTISVRPVQAADTTASHASIFSGIANDEFVVIEKNGLLTDGLRVNYTEILAVPKTASDYLYYGNQYVKDREFEQAGEMFRKAMSVNPGTIDAGQRMIIGMTFHKVRNYDRAIEMYQKALEMNPRLELAYLNLARAYNEKLDPDMAIRIGRTALKINSEFADAYSAIGEAFLLKGNAKKAVRMCEQALSIDRGSAYGYRVLGDAYFKTGDIEKSIKVFNRAIILEPDQGHPYRMTALAYMIKGNQKKAIEYMKQSALRGDSDAKQYLIDHEVY